MNKKPIFDEYDRWADYDQSALYVRRTPKRVRNCRPTLASVIAQARKAGANVTGATVTKEGVSLEFGKVTVNSLDKLDDRNEWDVVKQ